MSVELDEEENEAKKKKRRKKSEDGAWIKAGEEWGMGGEKWVVGGRTKEKRKSAKNLCISLSLWLPEFSASLN